MPCTALLIITWEHNNTVCHRMDEYHVNIYLKYITCPPNMYRSLRFCRHFNLLSSNWKNIKRFQELVRWVKIRVWGLLVTSSSCTCGWSGLFIGLIIRKCSNRRSQARILNVKGVKQLHTEIYIVCTKYWVRTLCLLCIYFLISFFFIFFGKMLSFSKFLLNSNAFSLVKASCVTIF